MGLFSSNNKKEDEYKKKQSLFSSFSNDKKKKEEEKKRKDLNKRMSILGLFDDERDAVINEGYDPEDFEDDEMAPDDYHGDEE